MVNEKQKKAVRLKEKIENACIRQGLNLTIYDGGIGFVDPKENKIVMVWRPQFKNDKVNGTKGQMMERLIKADSLKDRASEYALSEDEYRRFCKIIDAESTAYDLNKVVEQLEERTAFLNGCTKYDNETAEQQKKSYDTMMMYEVKDLVDDLIEIVKGGGVKC